jgi:hypothetical protein
MACAGDPNVLPDPGKAPSDAGGGIEVGAGDDEGGPVGDAGQPNDASRAGDANHDGGAVPGDDAAFGKDAARADSASGLPEIPPLPKCEYGEMACNSGCLKKAGDTAGTCTAIQVGDPTRAITLSAASVYWSTATAIYFAPKIGGMPALFLGDLRPWEVAANSTDLFFIHGLNPTDSAVGVFRVPLGGGMPLQLSVGNLGAVFALDSNYIYFGDTAVGSWSVHRTYLGGGTTVDIAKAHGVDAMALGTNHVYWIDYDAPLLKRVAYSAIPANTNAASDGGARLTTDPAAIETFATGTVVDVAVRDGFVHWSDRATGTLWRRPEGGGDPIALASGAQPERLLVDATHVYWSTFTGTAALVVRTPVTGGATELVAAFPSFSFSDFAIDESAVFIACANDTVGTGIAKGAVIRVPK